MTTRHLTEAQALADDAFQDFAHSSLAAISQLQRELRQVREELAESLLREHRAIEELNRLKAQQR